MLNRINIVGELSGFEPKKSVSAKGKEYCSASICNKKELIKDNSPLTIKTFVNIVAFFPGVVKKLSSYKIGDHVFIEGELNISFNSETKEKKTSITVTEIEKLSGYSVNSQRVNSDNQANDNVDDDDEDLPF